MVKRWMEVFFFAPLGATLHFPYRLNAEYTKKLPSTAD